MATYPVFLFLVGLAMVYPADGLQSMWSVVVDEKKGNMYNIFPNYMFTDSYVSVSLLCYAREPTELTVSWSLRQVHCMEQMYEANLQEDVDIMGMEIRAEQEQRLRDPLSKKKMLKTGPGGNDTSDNDDVFRHLRSLRRNNTSDSGDNNVLKTPPTAFQMSINKKYTCGDHNIIILEDESELPFRRVSSYKTQEDALVRTVQRPPATGKKIETRVVSAWEDGMYHFELSIVPTAVNKTFQTRVEVQMHGRYGYLTAIDWPLLPYNGIMSFLYLVLSTAWIMAWARSHRFTLKIHVGMGLVAVAGAMSHTLVFVQNAAENSRGGGVMLIMWFAQILAVVQVTFLNYILLVVSTGYGINVPSLPMKTLVFMGGVCGLQFAVGVVWIVCTDTTLRIQYAHPILTKATLWIKAAIFVVIAAWIMISTIRTLIQLRQRRHAGTKIVTFTIFMVSCIIAFLVHIVMFGLSMGWMQACRTNWQIQWVFNSITHMEAFLLLIVLMVLWRPVDTAQSYAFAPLGMEGIDTVDQDSEEEEEVFSKETEKFKLDELG